MRQAVLEQGPQVSLDVVAERLGVTAPALFRRFGNRSEILLQALLPEERPAFLAHLDAGPDGRPINDQITDLCARIASWFQAVLPCISALRESGLACDQRDTNRVPPPLLALQALTGWVERARAAGLLVTENAEDAAMAVLGAIQAPIFIRHIAKRTEPWDAVAYGRRMATIFLHGLLPPSAKEQP